MIPKLPITIINQDILQRADEQEECNIVHNTIQCVSQKVVNLQKKSVEILLMDWVTFGMQHTVSKIKIYKMVIKLQTFRKNVLCPNQGEKCSRYIEGWHLAGSTIWNSGHTHVHTWYAYETKSDIILERTSRNNALVIGCMGVLNISFICNDAGEVVGS